MKEGGKEGERSGGGKIQDLKKKFQKKETRPQKRDFKDFKKEKEFRKKREIKTSKKRIQKKRRKSEKYNNSDDTSRVHTGCAGECLVNHHSRRAPQSRPVAGFPASQ